MREIRDRSTFFLIFKHSFPFMKIDKNKISNKKIIKKKKISELTEIGKKKLK